MISSSLDRAFSYARMVYSQVTFGSPYCTFLGYTTNQTVSLTLPDKNRPANCMLTWTNDTKVKRWKLYCTCTTIKLLIAVDMHDQLHLTPAHSIKCLSGTHQCSSNDWYPSWIPRHQNWSNMWPFACVGEVSPVYKKEAGNPKLPKPW